MIPLNTFFAPKWGFFTSLQEPSDELPFPEKSKYILESTGNDLRFYGKNGKTSDWFGQDDGTYHFISKAIKDGLYQEIPFPKDFSSANLMIQPTIEKSNDSTNCHFTY